ncbi:hypothetical protein HY837_04820, partial [archaeon]|nr:hypothetical protein [archaeon]
MIKKILLILLITILLSCSTKIEKKEELKNVPLEPVVNKTTQQEPVKEPAKIEKKFKEAPLNYPQITLPQKMEELEKNKLKIKKMLSNDCQYTKRTIDNNEQLYTPVFVELNDFGYLDRAQCQQPVDKEKSSKSVEQAAREHFKSFEKYLGLEGLTLEFDESREAYDTFIIRTKEQKYKDIPIVELKGDNANRVKISIFLSTSDIVKDLIGHYYRDIKIPEKPQITLEQARTNLIGTKTTFADESGDQITKEIKKNDVINNG